MTLLESIIEHVGKTTISKVDSVWNEEHEEDQTRLILLLLKGSSMQINLIFYKGNQRIYKIEVIIDRAMLLQSSFSEQEGSDSAVYKKIKDKLVIFTTGGKIEVALT